MNIEHIYINDVREQRYGDVDTQLTIHTEQGLRSTCYYDSFESEPYTVYPSGDKLLGFVTFIVFKYYDSGAVPAIASIESIGAA